MTGKTRLHDLIQAFAYPLDKESKAKPFSPQHWAMLDGYLTRVELKQGQTLFQRDRDERSLYLLESGRVTVHYENAKGTLRMGFVSPGSVFGEASFLGNLPRQASATVADAGVAWALSRIKFMELYRREPDLGMEVVQMAASILARRSRDARRRRVIA
ncbi:MAG: cyclic nucleotide-binding domain-containing protein [Comamonadaceae bacterium]|nr:cyclic nucleotide-binding domain-containing protein [Comamonadaceae bacterium]